MCPHPRMIGRCLWCGVVQQGESVSSGVAESLLCCSVFAVLLCVRVCGLYWPISKVTTNAPKSSIITETRKNKRNNTVIER